VAPLSSIARSPISCAVTPGRHCVAPVDPGDVTRSRDIVIPLSRIRDLLSFEQSLLGVEAGPLIRDRAEVAIGSRHPDPLCLLSSHSDHVLSKNALIHQDRQSRIGV